MYGGSSTLAGIPEKQGCRCRELQEKRGRDLLARESSFSAEGSIQMEPGVA